MGLCNKIDKLVRQFLWCSNTEQRKMHLISWEMLTKRKEHGGLGIITMHRANLAFMEKLR